MAGKCTTLQGVHASLIKYLTHFSLHYMHKCLQLNQTLYVAGGYDNVIQDTCWFVRNNANPQPDPRYTSNAEETIPHLVTCGAH